LGDVLVEYARSALIEDGALGSLENDVVAGIAFIELALDFLSEVVFFVFGFPVAVGKVVNVDQGAIDDDRGLCALDSPGSCVGMTTRGAEDLRGTW